MPRRHAAPSLRHAAILAIGRSFDLVCYGLRSPGDLNTMMETSGYLDTDTPLASLPAPLLEDMTAVICRSVTRTVRIII